MTRPSPRTVRRLIGLALRCAVEAVPRLGLLPELFLPPLTKTLTVLVVRPRDLRRGLAGDALRGRHCHADRLRRRRSHRRDRRWRRYLRNLMLPVFSSLYAVPIVILYPIFTAWFGIGSGSKDRLRRRLRCFFPVMLSTAAGIRTIDEQYLLAARQHGRDAAATDCPRHHPGLDPDRVAGLRLGGALTIIGVVVSEMLTSPAASAIW